MKIWQVWDGDYDSQWVVATYDSEALAKEHAETYGLSQICEVDILSELDPDAADPIQREERSAQRAINAENERRGYEQRAAIDKQRHEWQQSVRIEQLSHPKLCHCRVFTSSDWRELPSGLCRYCHGWTPEVFRAHLGDDVLEREIAKLDLHYRTRMRELCHLI